MIEWVPGVRSAQGASDSDMPHSSHSHDEEPNDDSHDVANVLGNQVCALSGAHELIATSKRVNKRVDMRSFPCRYASPEHQYGSVGLCIRALNVCMHVGGVNRSDLQILLPSRLWICERGRLYRANQGLVPLQVLREGELHKNQWNVPRQIGMRFRASNA
jgi:hypothetical protein